MKTKLSGVKVTLFMKLCCSSLKRLIQHISVVCYCHGEFSLETQGCLLLNLPHCIHSRSLWHLLGNETLSCAWASLNQACVIPEKNGIFAGRCRRTSSVSICSSGIIGFAQLALDNLNCPCIFFPSRKFFLLFYPRFIKRLS